MWYGSWVINFAKTPSRPRDGSGSGPPPVMLLVFARGTMERLPSSTMCSGVPPEDPVRPRQSRPSWFSRKGHQDPVQAPPDEPEEPARSRWNTPEFGRWAHGAGEWILRLNDINGIECRAKLRDTFVGGPELAAEHSAATVPHCSRSSRMRLPPERRAKHEAR